MDILSQIIVWCLTNIKCTWQRFGSCCTSVMPCSAIRGCEKSTSPACHFKSLNLYTSMHTKLQEILGSIGRGFAGVGSRIATRKRSLPQFDMCQSWDGAAFNIANGETKKRGKLMVGPAISRGLFLCRNEPRNGQTGSTLLGIQDSPGWCHRKVSHPFYRGFTMIVPIFTVLWRILRGINA